MAGGLNILDLTLLALMGFFVVRALVRGFVREIMGLVGLVASLYLGAMTYHPLAEFLRRISAVPAGWWDAVAFALVVALVLGAFVYLGAGLARLVHAGPFSGLDRLLGAAAGAVKGLLFSYLLLNLLLMAMPLGLLGRPGSNHNSLVGGSLVAPYVVQGGRLLLDLVPNDWTRRLQERAGLAPPAPQPPPAPGPAR